MATQRSVLIIDTDAKITSAQASTTLSLSMRATARTVDSPSSAGQTAALAEALLPPTPPLLTPPQPPPPNLLTTHLLAACRLCCLSTCLLCLLLTPAALLSCCGTCLLLLTATLLSSSTSLGSLLLVQAGHTCNNTAQHGTDRGSAQAGSSLRGNNHACCPMTSTQAKHGQPPRRPSAKQRAAPKQPQNTTRTLTSATLTSCVRPCCCARALMRRVPKEKRPADTSSSSSSSAASSACTDIVLLGCGAGAAGLNVWPLCDNLCCAAMSCYVLDPNNAGITTPTGLAPKPNSPMGDAERGLSTTTSSSSSSSSTAACGRANETRAFAGEVVTLNSAGPSHNPVQTQHREHRAAGRHHHQPIRQPLSCQQKTACTQYLHPSAAHLLG